MEDSIRKVPLINQLILKNLDEMSRENFKKASRGADQVLEKESGSSLRDLALP